MTKTEINSGALDEGFLRRTYRSGAFLTGFTLLYLWAYALTWALVPVLVGASLALGMLYLAEVSVRRTFGAPEETKKNVGGRAASQALLHASLIKYLLNAPLLWAVASYWDTARIAAFAGGITLIHFGIALRALSRCLVARLNRSSSSDHRNGSDRQGFAAKKVRT